MRQNYISFFFLIDIHLHISILFGSTLTDDGRVAWVRKRGREYLWYYTPCLDLPHLATNAMEDKVWIIPWTHTWRNGLPYYHFLATKVRIFPIQHLNSSTSTVSHNPLASNKKETKYMVYQLCSLVWLLYVFVGLYSQLWLSTFTIFTTRYMSKGIYVFASTFLAGCWGASLQHVSTDIFPRAVLGNMTSIVSYTIS